MSDSEDEDYDGYHRPRMCRKGFRQNLIYSNSPAAQYQRQKIIQKTVRVPSSLFTMNLGALSAYRFPLTTYQTVAQAGSPYVVPPGVNWNQMSDRPSPSVQVVKTGSGSTYGASSTRHSIVRMRPGAMSPGGVGVDIKHNSYDRYLNRLKAQKPIRRGIVTVGPDLPGEKGGKRNKMGIIDSCKVCDNVQADEIVEYFGQRENIIQEDVSAVRYVFHVGDRVWAKIAGKWTIAQITEIAYDLFTVVTEATQETYTLLPEAIQVFYNCHCEELEAPIEEQILNSTDAAETTLLYCTLINHLTASKS